ncbi:MAG: hypothetical protein IPK19_23185 [Chloroflexi bacterium]|nr:hypothetical protein [Chloroflexota bacterium]
MAAAVVPGNAQDQPDYRQYEILDVVELDLYAAPGDTAAYLAPDGTQFAHIDDDRVCLYTQDGGQWVEDHCLEFDEDVDIGSPEEMLWSPDGRFLRLSTFREAFVYFRDSDIRVLDGDRRDPRPDR